MRSHYRRFGPIRAARDASLDRVGPLFDTFLRALQLVYEIYELLAICNEIKMMPGRQARR